MTYAVMLITDVLYSGTATAITGSLVLLMFSCFWILLPFHGRHEASDN